MNSITLQEARSRISAEFVERGFVVSDGGVGWGDRGGGCAVQG